MMRDCLALLMASAALVLTACGGAGSQVKTVPPAAAPSAVVEYHPGPSPAVEVSTDAAVQVSSPPAEGVAVSTWTGPVPNVVPHEPPPSLSADVNAVVLISEAVGDPALDLGSYTKVFVDNQPAGQTQSAPKSERKVWGSRLAAGNHLFRFEKWNLPVFGPWSVLDAQWQPPERFIRVQDGMRTVVRLKFYDEGRGHDLKISREPLSSPLP